MKMRINYKDTVGSGGYGIIYKGVIDGSSSSRASDRAERERPKGAASKEYAVKCIPKGNNGIDNMMEQCIMANLRHPYLNHAQIIRNTNDMVYIAQEIAISDLKKYIHSSQENISIERKLQWIYQLVQSVRYLHNMDIIHGDLKCNNILIYSDDNIKLNDFSLSTFKHWSRKYTPCTATHRPLEVWMGEEWDEKVDIWALGCTIFEILYGKNLFPSQTNKKKSSRSKYLFALRDWFVEMEYIVSGDSFLQNIKEEYVSYTKVSHIKDVSPPRNINLHQLMMSMLHPHPQHRPSIQEIGSDPIFESISKVSSFHGDISQSECEQIEQVCEISQRNQKIPRAQQMKIVRAKYALSRIFDTDDDLNQECIRIAIVIYTAISSGDILPPLNTTVKIGTAAWMAFKMVYRKPMYISKMDLINGTNKLNCKFHQLIEAENMICNYLDCNLDIFNSL